MSSAITSPMKYSSWAIPIRRRIAAPIAGAVPSRVSPVRSTYSQIRYRADAGEEDVQPVEGEREPQVDVVSQERGREREEGDDREEEQLEPGEVAVAALDVAELGLLPVPEDAQGQEAQEVRDEPRREISQG